MFHFIKKTLAVFGISSVLVGTPMVALAILNPPIFMALMGFISSILVPMLGIAGTLINAGLNTVNQGLKEFLKLDVKYKGMILAGAGIAGLGVLRYHAQAIKQKYNPSHKTIVSENGYIWYSEGNISILKRQTHPSLRSSSEMLPERSEVASQRRHTSF